MKIHRNNFTIKVTSFKSELERYGQLLGNLVGRAVLWLKDFFGTAKKTAAVSQEIMCSRNKKEMHFSTNELLKIVHTFKLDPEKSLLNSTIQDRKHSIDVMGPIREDLLKEISVTSNRLLGLNDSARLLRLINLLLSYLTILDWLMVNNCRPNSSSKIIYEKVQKIATELFPLMENRLVSLA